MLGGSFTSFGPINYGAPTYAAPLTYLAPAMYPTRMTTGASVVPPLAYPPYLAPFGAPLYGSTAMPSGYGVYRARPLQSVSKTVAPAEVGLDGRFIKLALEVGALGFGEFTLKSLLRELCS